MGYKFLEHMSDQYVEVWGRDWDELFSSSARAFYETITDTKKVKNKIEKKFEIDSDNIEDLLFKFLNKLLFMFDTEKFVGSKYDVKIRGNKLVARIYGDIFNPKLYESRFEVKGITLHNFKIWKDNLLRARFLLDL